jgi:transcriptional regulator with XRE-family HTH domain
MNLGRSVKLCRIQRGMSQSDLAEKTGLSSAYVSLIETNKRDVPFSTISRIAEALRVPVSIIVFLGTDPNELSSLPTDLRQKLAGAAIMLMNDDQS